MQHDREIHELRPQPNISDISPPELIDAAHLHIFGQIDLKVVIRIRSHYKLRRRRQHAGMPLYAGHYSTLPCEGQRSLVGPHRSPHRSTGSSPQRAPQQARPDSSPRNSALCALDESGERTLEMAVCRMNLSARAHDRMLRMARTVADLYKSTNVSAKHLAEAVQFRNLDRNFGISVPFREGIRNTKVRALSVRPSCRSDRFCPRTQASPQNRQTRSLNPRAEAS